MVEKKPKGKVSVIIPTLDEESAIFNVVADFKRHFPNAGIHVIDGNSTDRTVELARKAGAVVKMQKGKGKGAAIRQAFREIPADIYLLVDGDGTYLAEDGVSLVKAVERKEAEMAVGSRINERMERGAITTFNRIGNGLFRSLVMLFLQKNIADPLSGYRAIDGKIARSMHLSSKSFEIEMELITSFLNRGYRIKEIPVRYRRRHNSTSKLKPVSDGMTIMKMLLMKHG